MQLTALGLTSFRNYSSRLFTFTTPITVFLGRNAAGKTNILEAISLLGTGESFKAGKIEEMISWGEEVGHVTGKVKEGTSIEELRVTLTRGMVGGKKTTKRRFLINGVGKRKEAFAERLPVVVFEPEDMDLISGSPGKRRRYIDSVLSQASREYRRSWGSYEKGLRRRNKLLDLVREGQAPRNSLLFWNQLLIKEGELLQEKRQEFIDYLNTTSIFEGNRLVRYKPSLISEARIEQYKEAEIAVGYTLVGPHKDDFVLLSIEDHAERDLSPYGSRGEQRMAVLWLKMAELMFLTDTLGQRPLLLLDDIFSELDEQHDSIVRTLLPMQQTIITTTEKDEANKITGARIIAL